MRSLKGKVKKENKKEDFQREAPYLARDQGSLKVHTVPMIQYRVQLPEGEGKDSFRDIEGVEVPYLYQEKAYLGVHIV